MTHVKEAGLMNELLALVFLWEEKRLKSEFWEKCIVRLLALLLL
jgi:hypothetical protein